MSISGRAPLRYRISRSGVPRGPVSIATSIGRRYARGFSCFRHVVPMVSVSPRKITVVWELGGGMGHAARLAPIIQALVAAGHCLNVVARAPRRIYEALDGGMRDSAAVTYYRAPALPPRATVRGGVRPVRATVADILVEDGFAEPVGLSAYLGEWRHLLGSLSSALVISDFSPFANLVAADMAPLLVVGNGYAIPPAGNVSFLDLPLSRQSLVNHDHLLAVLAVAARGVGAAAPAGAGADALHAAAAAGGPVGADRGVRLFARIARGLAGRRPGLDGGELPGTDLRPRCGIGRGSRHGIASAAATAGRYGGPAAPRAHDRSFGRSGFGPCRAGRRDAASASAHLHRAASYRQRPCPPGCRCFGR